MNSSAPTRFQIYPEPFCSVGFSILCVGMLGNLLIIIAIGRTKSQLRLNKCNELVLVLAVVDLCTCVGYQQIQIQTWYGWKNMDNASCFYASVHTLFFMNLESYLVWVVGFDRLFMIKAPLTYQACRSTKYFVCLVIPGVLFSLMGLGIGLDSASSQQIVPLCMPPTAFNGRSASFWVGSTLIINLLVVITHVYCFVLSRKHGNDIAPRMQPGSNAAHRLGQSIAIVGLVYVSTWMVTIASLTCVRLFKVDPSTFFHVSLYVGWGAYVNVSCNVFIYAVRSTAYRKEFLRVLCCTRAAARMPTDEKVRNSYSYTYRSLMGIERNGKYDSVAVCE